MKAQRRWCCLVGIFLTVTPAVWAQKLSGIEREEAQGMLKNIAGDVRKHYYDPKFHGVDWEARVLETKNKIDNTATMNMALSHIAALMDALRDSHTFFVPPPRPYRHDYGYRAQMIGDHCYVTHVRPGTDAAAKGVKPGDELLGLEGYAVNDGNFRKMQYVFGVLRPQPGVRLVLRSPSGEERELEVMAKFRETKRIRDLAGRDADNEVWDWVRESESEEHSLRARYAELGDELMVLRLPAFYFDQTEVEGAIDIARKHKALIIDLRGNPGGSVDSLRYLVGSMFENEVKVADLVGRDGSKPQLSKYNYRRTFPGKLAVLVDRRSASAAELFARVIQLQKRGTVIGDHTAGAVMESKRYSYQVGAGTIVLFGASITEADVLMTDGKSLENTGVAPDQIMLPTAAELAAGLDPVLAKAAQDLGGKLTPEEAGKLFEFEWPPD